MWITAIIAVRMFGYKEFNSLYNQSIHILLSPAYNLHHVREVSQVFDSMKPTTLGDQGQVKGLRQDGSEFEISVQLSPAIIQVTGFAHYEKLVTCVCRDVTEHNQWVVRRIVFKP